MKNGSSSGSIIRSNAQLCWNARLKLSDIIGQLYDSAMPDGVTALQVGLMTNYGYHNRTTTITIIIFALYIIELVSLI
jgi:hypothetical protein